MSARIAPAVPRGLDPVRRIVYAASRRTYGRPLEPLRVVGHHRPLLMGYSAVALAGECFSRAVETPVKNLAMLRAAQLMGCEWCLDFGSRLARDSGAEEAQLRELSTWRESERFSPRQRLALAYAEAMTRTPVDVPDELFGQLRAEFDERQLVELTMSIALENMYSRSGWALRVQSEGFAEGAYCVPPDTGAAAPVVAPASPR